MNKTAIALVFLLAAILGIAAFFFLRDDRPAFAPANPGDANRRADRDGDPALPAPATAPSAAREAVDPARAPRPEGGRSGAGAGASTIVEIDGTVELWADFSVDAPLPPQNGKFELMIVADAKARRESVRVEAGRFRAKAPANALLEVTKFDFDGKTAWLNGDLRRPVPPDGKLRLIAMALNDVTLHVIDAETEAELRDVTVVAANLPWEHPGRVVAADTLVERANSPLALAPFVERQADMPRVAQLGRVWVGAPGHAWGQARAEFMGGPAELRVPLARGGALQVELRLAQPLDPPTLAALRLSVAKAGRDRPYFEVPARTDAANQVEGIEPGPFVVTVIAAPASGADGEPVVFGSAPVEVVAAGEARVTIDVARPAAERTRVAIGGTLEVASDWGALAGQLVLARTGAPAAETQSLALAAMAVERAEPRTLRFQAPPSLPGSWVATCAALGLRQEFEVGPQGATDVRLRAPDSAELRVAFIDAATLQPVAPVEFRWAMVVADREFEWTVANVPEAATSCTLRVPIGALIVWADRDGYGPCSRRFTVAPGGNEQRLPLEQPVGVRVTFTVADAPVDLALDDCPLHLRQLDGDGFYVQWTHVLQHDELYVSQPGRWELRCDPLAGYAPVEPLELELTRGALQDVTIALRRK